MGDLKEIVDAEQVSRLFLVLAIALPPAGALLGAIMGHSRGRLRRGAMQGLLFGMAGPFNLLLWRVYNALTDRIGLDTVRNLFVNLALFVIVGAGIGVCLGRAARRQPSEPAETRESEAHG